MNTALAMPELLERAGFRLRQRNRADCPHCSGRSIATVSYNNEVAHCFRCQWKANTVTLAKELGLLSTDPESRRKRQKEMQTIAEYRATIARFEAWRVWHIERWSAELRMLSREAVIAERDLKANPECDTAWDALARYCHREGELNQFLDYLNCTKASVWLDGDSTILGLFEAWKRDVDEKR